MKGTYWSIDIWPQHLPYPQHLCGSIHLKEKRHKVSKAVQTHGSATQAANDLMLVTTTYYAYQCKNTRSLVVNSFHNSKTNLNLNQIQTKPLVGKA